MVMPSRSLGTCDMGRDSERIDRPGSGEELAGRPSFLAAPTYTLRFNAWVVIPASRGSTHWLVSTPKVR